MSAAARKRRQAAKRDPYRAAQIAPSHPMEPVVCLRGGCGHARLMHREPIQPGDDEWCIACGCLGYEGKP